METRSIPILTPLAVVKEKLSKIPLNNLTTSTAEDTSASSHIPKSTNESPAAVATAFGKLDVLAQESEGEAAFEQEAGFEIVEKDEAMEDEDDMVVVEEPEEEEDYVEV